MLTGLVVLLICLVVLVLFVLLHMLGRLDKLDTLEGEIKRLRPDTAEQAALRLGRSWPSPAELDAARNRMDVLGIARAGGQVAGDPDRPTS